VQSSQDLTRPSIRSAAELQTYLHKKGLSWETAHLPAQALFEHGFPLRIPEFYAELIDWQDPTDPLRLMVIPDIREAEVRPYELTDPIGDHAREVVPGLIHRYPDRCLLLLTSYCLVHCRFCFRREVVGKVRPVQFQHIQEYLAQHPEVRELIFSGGDPFTFPVGFVQSLTQHLTQLTHVTTWRFHSRVPAIDPAAVSDEWIGQLQELHTQWKKRVIIVIHINHPREVTTQFKHLVEKLIAAGCLLLSQTVLLKGVNTDHKTLADLFRSLVLLGVKPYYLHHLDQVVGSHHFRISIEEGKTLFHSLRGNVSGVCMPEYVLDLPGGDGKVPVMWMHSDDHKEYQVTTFEGKKVTYVDQAE